jgi:D-ribose pyranase
MKKGFLLNSEVSYAVSRIGHTESLGIADCGLPIPPRVERIDLAVSAGIPSFFDVLTAVLSEMQVEKVLLAEELRQNAPFRDRILRLLREHNPKVEVAEVSHAVFKEESAKAQSIVRTGEQTPFANILLYSGVVF